MSNTFCIYSEDQPGVLSRVAALIYRRGYNIISIAAGPTEVKGVSRYTLVFDGEESTYDQVQKQLQKLAEVISVRNLTREGNTVERYLKLIKVKAPVSKRPSIFQTAEVFRCRVVDIGADTISFEVTGSESKVEACLAALEPYGIVETAGSGQVSLARSGLKSNKDK
ncbi:MAG: acetolactate synthase small subunit [Synergistaceae bacterium]|nr:acetolactate synthase small subunit [Candidatus Equadaptatus faecalis]